MASLRDFPCYLGHFFPLVRVSGTYVQFWINIQSMSQMKNNPENSQSNLGALLGEELFVREGIERCAPVIFFKVYLF